MGSNRLESKIRHDKAPPMHHVEHWWYDTLTGLPDRRWFTEMLRIETRRTTRVDAPLSLLILGVDHFTAYNNIHGIAAGDVCLQVIADTLRHSFRRAGDFIARLEQDNFGVIMPATTETAAYLLAQRLVKNVQTLGITNAAYLAQETGVLTVSAGIATNRDHWDMDGKALWVVADQAMLRAKRSGRNRVATADS